MKVTVRSSDRDTDFFDIVAEVFQEDAFVYNLLRLRTSNVDRSDKRKWLYAEKKVRSKRYPAETLTDALCRLSIGSLLTYLPELNTTALP